MPAAECSALRIPCAAVESDPLLAYQPMPFSATFSQFGFPVTVETNCDELAAIASKDRCLQHSEQTRQAVRLTLGVTISDSKECPPCPTVRAQGHLLTLVCDSQNFVTCDLAAGSAFGWVSSATLLHPEFLRYHLVDSAVMCLLSAVRLTPLHAACVSYAGRGLLLHGESGAGKSTLAYACARAGWTYTTDDASYMLRDGDDLRVRGNCTQFRFRPAATELFPELAGHPVAPRMEGKPSMVVSTREFPHMVTAPEASIDAWVVLARHQSSNTYLTQLAPEDAMAILERSLFPLPRIRELQRPSAQRVLRAKLYSLHYRDLDPAIECLQQMLESCRER